MEQFDNQQPKNPAVKEKSVYLLHLDGARILILSAITIGLLTVAFLIGMKITGDTSKENISAQNDTLMDQSLPAQSSDSPDSSKAALPELPNAAAEPTSNTNALPSIPTNQLPDLPVAKNKEMLKIHDSMAADESHIVIPPAKEVAKTEKMALKKNHKKTERRESLKKKKEILEVSSEEPAKQDKHTKGMFMIQVASYDKIDVAKKEVSSLKSKNYDAFVDKSTVKGKSFFRVRIGPVAAKDKAIQMLDEIQSNQRYSESYVVKE